MTAWTPPSWTPPSPGSDGRVPVPEAVLRACDPRPAGREGVLRTYCPVHVSDHQRSLLWDTARQRYRCFACGAWGPVLPAGSAGPRVGPPLPRPAPARPVPDPDRLARALRRWQAALPASPGERYLAARRIPLSVAQGAGLGFADPDDWRECGGRPGRWGRVVAPLMDATGALCGLYGRATGAAERRERHDVLGQRGVFRYGIEATEATEVAVVTEGVLDALALAAALGLPSRGDANGVAVWALGGTHAPLPPARALLLALDADAAGDWAWRALAREAALRGRRVAWLPAAAFGGADDPAAAWQAGTLDAEALCREIEALRAADPQVDRPPAALPPAQLDPQLPGVGAEDAGPGGPVVLAVRRWVAARCRSEARHSVALEPMLRDFTRWARDNADLPAPPARPAFARALEGLGVRVYSNAVVVGLVLRPRGT